MPFPKFSPLQSRFAASLIASVILLMLYFTFSSNHFAYAADVESVPPEDHNHDRLFEMEMDMLSASTADPESRDDGGYEAAFLGYDRGIIGKAPILDLPTQLTNNVPQANNLEQGQTNFYLFPSSALGLRARSIEDGEADVMEERDEELYPADLDRRLLQRDTTSRLVYISVNVCLQPNPIQSTTVNPPPQLQLYISQTESNPNPGPDSDGAQETFTLERGATNQTVNATGDIYMGLYGQNTTAYNGVWSTQIAASTDAFYHSILSGSGSNLGLVDSDSSSALLITGNLTNENASSPAFQAVMDAAPPYVLFVSNISDQYIQGVQNSYCGLQQNAQFAPSVTGQSASNVQASLTTRGIGVPRQQFYLTGINNGTTYTAALAKYGGGNSTSNSSGVIGGGGTVWPMMNFTTLSDGNCALIFNLSFCDQTAYAVPSNPDNFPNMSSLASFYDNASSQYFQFFQNALAQIPCNTTSAAKYSLARNCDDCAASYKDWLCAVSMPRCTDFSSDLPWLQERSMIYPFPNGTMLPAALVSFANQSAFLSSSRIPQIDQYVVPGPYKEILPCNDLCYGIVQSCPSALSFNCPRPGWTAFDYSYGLRTQTGGSLTCNYPGAELDQVVMSRSGTTKPHLLMIVTLVVMMWVFV